MKRDDIFAKYTTVPQGIDGSDEAAKQFYLIKNALDQVARLDHSIVPKAWLETFPESVRETMESIGEYLDSTPRFFMAGAAFRNLDEYRKAHGQTYRMFVATLSYFATGEGNTVKLFAHHAHNLGEFIATIDDDPYFIQGMDFFEGKPPADNSVFNAFDTKHLRSLIEDKKGHVEIKLQTHVNYS